MNTLDIALPSTQIFLLFIISVAILIIGLRRMQKQEGDRGGLVGYEPGTGTQNPYAIAKDAEAIQKGDKPAPQISLSYGLISGLVLVVFGAIPLILGDYSSQNIAISAMFLFVAFFIVSGVIAQHGGLHIKSRFIAYLIGCTFLLGMLGFIVFVMIPGITRGEGIGAVLFVAVSMITGSLYSYRRAHQASPPQ